MKNGVPFDVAMTLEDADVLGMCVAFGIMEGGEFDWREMRWRKKD